ncbi:HEAT repeat domain-containing protein [Streptomyces hirsutus]|uniref:HEAT repeat domain-containing protein n=1 Tax=Streptomyces hirsutus TaxID=35620 RepID=A0ABZ1H094_9ACTN|nr:HEAT repeat domain-containing protein [Streptomyces hirsutus]WSD10684.1 HEAT repeat domain-containing protein [Streptomyces hirsutus]WTD15968.1 HEAT repeat domain-containing protein [Streptomyces hirsutus]
MINDVDSIDWSSMGHAYGPAVDVPVWLRAMASPDPGVRERALGDFYSAAHHQGDVYACTAASLPFLFALADDPATPDRASIVELLVSIGRESVDRDDGGVRCAPDGTISTACTDSAAMMRDRSEAFVAHAADVDPGVRRAAIAGLGLFLDDADRAVDVLRSRLPAASGIIERLLVVKTMADLALRLPAAWTVATAWLRGLADDASADPDVRLAALVHHARCVPEAVGDDTVPVAIDLLHRLTPAPQPKTDEKLRRAGSGSGTCVCTPAPDTASPDAPPQIVAAFADMERHNRVHAPTTPLLRTLHRVLDHRVPERTTLLTEQLRSPDPATRFDAIDMAQDLIGSWRGNHAHLVTLIAECLLPEDPYTAVAAAETLGSLVPVTDVAREALAAFVAAQRTAHGPDVWAAPDPLLRRAHQEAVTALARLDDPRALPGLLTALDSDVDAWRTVQVAGHLRRGAEELVPRLCRRLAAVDFSQQAPGFSGGSLTSALAALGDPGAVPAITQAVTAAVRHEQWHSAASALEALASFGTDAGPALDVVRPLADAPDVDLRAAATAALWALERDPADIVPRLRDLLGSHCHRDAADVLGRIGPAAVTALPRLKEMMTAGYEWTRLHAAIAVWDITGEAEADSVIGTLLEVWEKNEATAYHIVTFLSRMGPAAAPALPRLRAELARARRGRGVAHDEEVQRTCRILRLRLAALQDRERKHWELVPGAGVGPLRLGMSPAEVAHALQESATPVGGPCAQEDFATAGVSVFYDDAGHLACIALGAATGPQTTLAGVPLAGRDPGQMEQWLLEDYAAEHEGSILFTPDGSFALTDLGLLIRTQQIGGTRLTRPLIVIEDWFESTYHRDHLPLEGSPPQDGYSAELG